MFKKIDDPIEALFCVSLEGPFRPRCLVREKSGVRPKRQKSLKWGLPIFSEAQRKRALAVCKLLKSARGKRLEDGTYASKWIDNKKLFWEGVALSLIRKSKNGIFWTIIPAEEELKK